MLALLQQEESELRGLTGGNGQLWTLGIGLLATALATTYVTRLAQVLVRISSKLSPAAHDESRRVLELSSEVSLVNLLMQDAVKDIE